MRAKDATTIQIKRKTVKILEEFKSHPRQPISEVIEKLIELHNELLLKRNE